MGSLTRGHAVDFLHLPLSNFWHLLVADDTVKTQAPLFQPLRVHFLFTNSAREHAIDYLANVRHRVSFPSSSRDMGHKS